MKFSGTFDAALKDPNSAGFRTKAREIEKTVLSALNDDSIGGVKVTKFEAGLKFSSLNIIFFFFKPHWLTPFLCFTCWWRTTIDLLSIKSFLLLSMYENILCTTSANSPISRFTFGHRSKEPFLCWIPNFIVNFRAKTAAGQNMNRHFIYILGRTSLQYQNDCVSMMVPHERYLKFSRVRTWVKLLQLCHLRKWSDIQNFYILVRWLFYWKKYYLWISLP